VTIRLRFVRGNSIESAAIIADTGGAWSHVECVLPDGRYLGAHADVGVQALPNNYDADTFEDQKFLDLPCVPSMSTRFYIAAEKHIGEPYDFLAIAGFVSHLDLHEKAKVICSALITLCLRDCGWFATPLAEPAHKISPRDLYLIISGRIPVN
jgi:hypothetical protein